MATQAALPSITSAPAKSRLKHAARIVADVWRQLITPAIFSDPRQKTILVPVPDDGWSPEFRCGEFAVVDTTNIEPEDGAFVYRRGLRNNLSIVKLRRWNEAEAATITVMPGRSGPHWSMLFGRQRVGNWRPECEAWAPGGFVHMKDGPLCDKFLREEIIGRVIGVLGANERALNWRVK